MIWSYDRSRSQWRAEVKDATFVVSFHKVGGRYSKGKGESYWTFMVYLDSTTYGNDYEHFATALAAKVKAIHAYEKKGKEKGKETNDDSNTKNMGRNSRH